MFIFWVSNRVLPLRDVEYTNIVQSESWSDHCELIKSLINNSPT